MSRDVPNLGRVRWMCRRGMLELDLILLEFLDKGYMDLSDESKHTFVKLLDEEDPTLHSWFLGQSTPEDSDLAAIVAQIRQFP